MAQKAIVRYQDKSGNAYVETIVAEGSIEIAGLTKHDPILMVKGDKRRLYIHVDNLVSVVVDKTD